MADDNRNQGNDREPSGGGNWMKSLLIWAGILLALMLVVQTMSGSSSQARDAIAYSDFLTRVDNGQVKQVAIGKDSIVGQTNEGATFRTNKVDDPNLTTRLREKGDAMLRRHFASEIGRRRRVIAEGDGHEGHSEYFTRVALTRPSPRGEMLDVKISGHDGRRLLAA